MVRDGRSSAVSSSAASVLHTIYRCYYYYYYYYRGRRHDGRTMSRRATIQIRTRVRPTCVRKLRP